MPESTPSTMHVEQRWCVIEDNLTYPYGQSEDAAVRFMGRHPEGMREGGFTSSTTYPLRLDPRTSQVNVNDYEHMYLPASPSRLDYADQEVRVLATPIRSSADRIRLSYTGRWETGLIDWATSFNPKTTAPEPEPDPVIELPPCSRCGAPIHASPYFSKGRPCPCRGE